VRKVYFNSKHVIGRMRKGKRGGKGEGERHDISMSKGTVAFPRHRTVTFLNCFLYF